jgi:hypothetical protein
MNQTITITKLPNDCQLRQYPDGLVIYYRGRVIHREDGPAVIEANGNKEWFFNGVHIPCTNQNQFERLLKLKAFW